MGTSLSHDVREYRDSAAVAPSSSKEWKNSIRRQFLLRPLQNGARGSEGRFHVERFVERTLWTATVLVLVTCRIFYSLLVLVHI